jgi:deoxyadenosine/deoxycytidine kinase
MNNNGKVTITEGIIGVGKTTFSEALSEHLNAQWMKEPDEECGNPYLHHFYEDPKRWALTMQLHLLNTRYRMHMNAQWCSMQSGKNIVIDRSYFGDTAFANLQLENKTLTQDEFNTYCMSYQNMTSCVLLPQVCVFLDVEPKTAQKRVKKRMEIQTGRVCENAIDLQYLIDLKKHQDRVIQTLDNQGVRIITLDWNLDRTKEEICTIAKSVATEIININQSTFMDFHRRTM